MISEGNKGQNPILIFKYEIFKVPGDKKGVWYSKNPFLPLFFEYVSNEFCHCREYPIAGVPPLCTNEIYIN